MKNPPKINLKTWKYVISMRGGVGGEINGNGIKLKIFEI